jgi:hypothetical protein
MNWRDAVTEVAKYAPAVAAAIGPVLGYLGPRATHAVLAAFTDRIRGGGE